MNDQDDKRDQKSPPPQRQQQQQGGDAQQYGEGNYKATRDYNEGVKDHMQNHDVEKEARDAAPKSDAEAKEMERAEEEGRARAKGDSKDMPEDPAER
ncbi:MAG TPA: hypothetical protein VH040_10850 [Usitatibacter sp.]|jgi:hypothetical protein|nr:hypothetical protein [Usitatibacter sp.]